MSVNNNIDTRLELVYIFSKSRTKGKVVWYVVYEQFKNFGFIKGVSVILSLTFFRHKSYIILIDGLVPSIMFFLHSIFITRVTSLYEKRTELICKNIKKKLKVTFLLVQSLHDHEINHMRLLIFMQRKWCMRWSAKAGFFTKLK